MAERFEHDYNSLILGSLVLPETERLAIYPVGNTDHLSLCMAVLRHSAYNNCGPLYPVALAFSPLKKVHPVDQPISACMDGSSIPVDQPISAHMNGSSIEGAACCGQWSVERKFQLLSISWASVAECVECRGASQDFESSSPIGIMTC